VVPQLADTQYTRVMSGTNALGQGQWAADVYAYPDGRVQVVHRGTDATQVAEIATADQHLLPWQADPSALVGAILNDPARQPSM